MKILLASPPAGFSYKSIGIRRPPLGLAYLAAVLKDRHEVKIVDFNAERKKWDKYSYDGYDIVGITVDTARYDISVKIAALAKARGATVVMGGPHVSFMDRATLETGVVDYVVRNEGEYSFLSLVRFLSDESPFEDVRGVSYLSDGETRRTPDAAFIDNLDSLPFPARELLHLNLYNEKMNGRPTTTIITSRGCPFNCHFCSSSQFFGFRWRSRSAENVFEEMKLLHEKYNYRALSFVEDNFTSNPDRAVRLSEMIIDRGWDLIWGAYSRVDTIVKNPGMVRIMARAGFRWTFIGFESGNQDVLNQYGKKARVQDDFKAMEILKQNGVGVTGSFIIGAPDEDRSMIEETIELAKRLNPVRAQFSILTPYPGTKLYEKVKDRLLPGKWDRYSGGNATMRLDHLSHKKLKRLLILSYFRFYVRPVKLVQNISYFLKAIASMWEPLLPKLKLIKATNFIAACFTYFVRYFKGAQS